MKNYYAILGVLPSAEDVVIRAAYKALVQRYHPDKYTGNPQEAHAQTKELNEAYEVLSNAHKRKLYNDEWRLHVQNADNYFSEEQADTSLKYDPFAAAWSKAEDYYPDLAAIIEYLNQTSWKLAFTYKAQLLEKKQFAERHIIAQKMQEEFLQTYFGRNPQIIEFARYLITNKHKAAAKELNEAVGVLGSGIDAERVVQRIKAKYFADESAVNTQETTFAEVLVIAIATVMGFLILILIVTGLGS